MDVFNLEKGSVMEITFDPLWQHHDHVTVIHNGFPVPLDLLIQKFRLTCTGADENGVPQWNVERIG